MTTKTPFINNNRWRPSPNYNEPAWVSFRLTAKHFFLEKVADQRINQPLELSKKDGLSELLFSHWILGEESKDREPRWSIMCNVLGWGEQGDQNLEWSQRSLKTAKRNADQVFCILRDSFCVVDDDTKWALSLANKVTYSP